MNLVVNAASASAIAAAISALVAKSQHCTFKTVGHVTSPNKLIFKFNDRYYDKAFPEMFEGRRRWQFKMTAKTSAMLTMC